MMESGYSEKSVELGKYFAYDEICGRIVDLQIKYVNEAINGDRCYREAIEIGSVLGTLFDIAIVKKEEALKKC